MGKFRLGMLLLLAAASASAQEMDVGFSEIVVTGTRTDLDNYSARQPIVGLRRQADFVIQPIIVMGDTRDAEMRHQEMYQTIRKAIALAPSHGVELAYGETVVELLTVANFENLSFKIDNRPDSDKIELLVKSRLGGGSDARAATLRIDQLSARESSLSQSLHQTNIAVKSIN